MGNGGVGTMPFVPILAFYRDVIPVRRALAARRQTKEHRTHDRYDICSCESDCQLWLSATGICEKFGDLASRGDASNGSDFAVNHESRR